MQRVALPASIRYDRSAPSGPTVALWRPAECRRGCLLRDDRVAGGHQTISPGLRRALPHYAVAVTIKTSMQINGNIDALMEKFAGMAP